MKTKPFIFIFDIISILITDGVDESASAMWIEKYYVFEVTVKGHIFIYRGPMFNKCKTMGI